MGWIEKEQPTPFDAQPPVTGLYYVDGDVLARRMGRNWTAGQKLPMVVFPSGQTCELWEASHPEQTGIVHIFGELDLPLRDTRDRAFELANDIAEQCGYRARRVGDNGLAVYGHDDDENILVVYDNDVGQMMNMVRLTDEVDLLVVGVGGYEDLSIAIPERPLRMELLPDTIRARLPELYSNEELGLNALAQVKFFTPDSNYTWYASEYDGDDVVFGLVIGHEIELGYFLLSELEQARGPWGLPIERDKFFEAKTLRELRDQHSRQRDT